MDAFKLNFKKNIPYQVVLAFAYWNNIDGVLFIPRILDPLVKKIEKKKLCKRIELEFEIEQKKFEKKICANGSNFKFEIEPKKFDPLVKKNWEKKLCKRIEL